MTFLKGKIITKQDNGSSYSIHRSTLQNILKNQLQKEIIYNKEAVDFNEINGAIDVFFGDNSISTADYVVVADGFHSRIRDILYLASQKRYAGYTCWRVIVPNVNQIRAATTIWGSKGRIGIVPIPNDQVYCFVCLNAKVQDQNMLKYTRDDLLLKFNNYQPAILQYLEEIRDCQLIHNDIYDLKPLKRFVFGKILIIGDAAHASTPNIGQGAAQAFEDSATLKLLLQRKRNLDQCFVQFEKMRLKRVHYITKLSRRMGMISQLENTALIFFRNIFMSYLPNKWQNKKIQKVYKFKSGAA